MRSAMGDEWINSDRPATRVEIRVKRDALKCMGINSMDDLFENEWAIINLLTHHWVRILEEPKQKGHEYKQRNHPVWDRIRSLFRLYFPGGSDDAKAEWKTPEPVAANPERLEKQMLGCAVKVVALRHGEQPNEEATEKLVNDLVASVKSEFHEKVNEIARHTECRSGVPLGNKMPLDWNTEHMHTIEPALLERTRAEVGASFRSQEYPSPAPPVTAEGVDDWRELKGETARERLEEFFEKTKQHHVPFND